MKGFDERKTIYVYWKDIGDVNRNGPDFKYVVKGNELVRGYEREPVKVE